VRKKIEKEEIMIKILKIIAIAKDNDKNNVFNIIIKRIRNDRPRILFFHCLNNFPIKIRGNKLRKIIKRGII